MDKVVIALGPAFAAGFAIQRLLEILDPLLEKIQFFKDNKKVILGIISLLVGFVLAFGAGLTVLKPLGVTNPAPLLDEFTTGLVVSAGTEGFNSIMKFLGYSKEDKKAEAAPKMDKVADQALAQLQKSV